MDNDARPVLNQLNIVARDWDASLAFYRLLGLDVSDGLEFGPGARHAAVTVTGPAMTLEFDNVHSVPLFAANADNIKGPIIGFAYASADAVDATFGRLAAAGHPVRQAPHDAFFGARYAIVEDPNGNAIGLMGPIDRARGYTPGSRLGA
jgi:catechol 2,3-dioxygenase-like lactoylglutathione lyase family enzyme